MKHSRLSSFKKSNLTIANDNFGLALKNVVSTECSVTEMMHRVERLENELLQMPQANIPPNHYFGDNVYVREVIFPKGVVSTGYVHRTAHVSIQIDGHMTIWTPEKGLHDVSGFSITEVKPGMKRAGYAHADTRWLCAFGVKDASTREIDEVMASLAFSRYDDYLNFHKEHSLELAYDKQAFNLVLENNA